MCIFGWEYISIIVRVNVFKKNNINKSASVGVHQFVYIRTYVCAHTRIRMSARTRAYMCVPICVLFFSLISLDGAFRTRSVIVGSTQPAEVFWIIGTGQTFVFVIRGSWRGWGLEQRSVKGASGRFSRDQGSRDWVCVRLMFLGTRERNKYCSRRKARWSEKWEVAIGRRRVGESCL